MEHSFKDTAGQSRESVLKILPEGFFGVHS